MYKLDAKDNIPSSMLEAYLMGELNEEEMRKVDNATAQNSALKSELEALRESLNHYAGATGQKPSAGILAGALYTIDQLEDSAAPTEPTVPPHAYQYKVGLLWPIAASFLLLASLGFNWYYYHAFQSQAKQVAQLTVQRQALAMQVNTAKNNLLIANQRLGYFLNKDHVHVRMEGLPVAPEAYANVFWNKNTNAVFISVDNLPEPPHGHQYQLWAIKPGIPPIDAGIFDHSDKIQELKVIRGDVLAFAVTLEISGGTPIATVENTYVKGFL